MNSALIHELINVTDVPYIRFCLKNNRIHTRYYKPGCNKHLEHYH